MTQLLQINSSLSGDAGESSRLADAFVDAFAAAHPGTRITRRDLARETVPHLDAERFGAFVAAPAARTPAQLAIVAESDRLIGELQRADVLVLGLPMYNFGVPSQLKAWFDHIARAGITFRYTASGPVGLLTGKKAFVLATRGGLYAGSALDTQTAYVRDFLAFLGIADVEFIHAEGLAISESRKAHALTQAQDAIRRTVSPQRAAA